ncbi:hypothetical protein TNCT_659851 [Trichonephila clavata]|uniref:Uncharacterized protein n=1 Tax=Trichonephila clavata TaxID=2740835 RepID=A0A8X6IXF0_TRICU|nr:hypothetical protein TNCT_659851 [Trichonephila clavata]
MPPCGGLPEVRLKNSNSLSVEYYQEEITPTISENKKGLNCEISLHIVSDLTRYLFKELRDHIKLDYDIPSRPAALGFHCHRVSCWLQS